MFKARSAISFLFFINGIVFAGWVSHIPGIRERFEITEATIGLILFVMAIGAVLVMVFTGWLVQLIGSRIISGVAGLSYAVTLLLLFLANDLNMLFFAAFLFGAANGSMDVSMNDQAVILEKRYGVPIMSSLHAFFSTGGLIGAALSYSVLRLGGHALEQAIGICVVIFLAAIYFLPHLIDGAAMQKKNRAGEKRFFFQFVLCLFAFLAFLSFMAEGVIADWSALYLKDYVNVSASMAVLGYAAFSFMMMVGRFSGDFLVQKYGYFLVFLVCGLLTLSGMIVVLFLPEPWVKIFGFGILGAGVSNLAPIIFSNAGRLTGVPSGIGIATVSVSGYSGFLAGPPLIGFISHHIGLDNTLIFIIFVGFIIMVGAWLFRK